MQTAVEFLDERYTFIKWMRDRDEASAETALSWYADAIRKAIELETQQIMDAFNQGYREGENDGSIGCVYNDDVAKHSDAADYWQTTYGTTAPIKTN
jgi:hypothetical protein